MRRVLASVEGQTEQALCINVIQGHLLARGISLQPVVVKTKRPSGGPAHSGGVSKWSHLQREIRNLLADTSVDLVTTMYDFYAFPPDAPGMEQRWLMPPGQERVAHVEEAMAEAIGHDRFFPYLSLHEVEALVLATPPAVLEQVAPGGFADRVTVGRGGREPELVNEEDPPSRLITSCWPGYVKPVDGPRIIAAAGIEAVRTRCPHFDRWLSRLEQLAASGAS